MKKLTYTNIAWIAALGFLVFLYYRSRKDTATATKATTPIGDSPKPVGDTGSSSSSGGGSASGSSSTTTGGGVGGELTKAVPVLSLGGIGGSPNPLGRNVYIITNNNTYSGNDGTASTGGGLSGTSGGGTTSNNNTAGNTGNTTGGSFA